MNSSVKRRAMCFESMEKRELFAADLGLDLDPPAGGAETAEVAEVGNAEAGDTWFIAESFSFGVEREMKESGEKGGTEDINIGVGELQECTISKSAEPAPQEQMQAATNGNSLGPAEIHFVEVGGGGAEADKTWKGDSLMTWDNTTHSPESDSGLPLSDSDAEGDAAAESFGFGVEREMKESGEKGGTEDINIGIGELHGGADPASADAVITSWTTNTSGDADDRPTEEVAFYYNKISFQYAKTVDAAHSSGDYVIWRKSDGSW